MYSFDIVLIARGFVYAKPPQTVLSFSIKTRNRQVIARTASVILVHWNA